LWSNLDEIGAKETADNNIIFTPDLLNTFCAAPRPAAPVNRSYTPELAKQNYLSIPPEISRSLTQHTIDIKSNAIGMDSIPVSNF
jgi:hypothetical protein